MTGEKPTILYIDDDADDLLIFSESINELYPGIDFIEAQSGEEGLKILNSMEEDSKSLPQLIILDMNMPKMDGKQSLKAIRSRKSCENIPIVIFTTSINTADIEFCKTYRADCVTKPMNYKSLHQIIQQLVSYSNIQLG